MTEETKAKIRAAHKARAQDPAVVARLREIAQDPAHKATRSTKMKAKWADPEWRVNQLSKMATTTGAREVETPPAPVEESPAPTKPARKKRIISPEKKAQYAAARKAKRAEAKLAAAG